ncbi:unnamed protein product [Chrysoparadoxa australica]
MLRALLLTLVLAWCGNSALASRRDGSLLTQAVHSLAEDSYPEAEYAVSGRSYSSMGYAHNRGRRRGRVSQPYTDSAAQSSWCPSTKRKLIELQRDVIFGVEMLSQGIDNMVQTATSNLVCSIDSSICSLKTAVASWTEGEALNGGMPSCGGMRRGGGQKQHQLVEAVTDELVQSAVALIRGSGWQHVASTDGVTVWKSVEADDGERFACVKAAAVIDAPAEVLFELFLDNSRVHEYNEHCKELADLEQLDDSTKVTWCASGRMGPFKARDFCSLVHFRTLSDGTMAQVSRAIDHPDAPPTSRYVRSELMMAGNFMRPVPGDPNKTEFITITQLNPGGAADSRAGAMLVNNIAASGPVSLVKKLEASAQRLQAERLTLGAQGGGQGQPGWLEKPTLLIDDIRRGLGEAWEGLGGRVSL